MKTSATIAQLCEALAKAQGQMKNPEKNRTAKIPMKAGGSYQYHYADLPITIDTSRQALADNGLSHTSGLEWIKGDGLMMTARLMHASGEWIESDYPLPSDCDEKTLAAKITYGRRYLFTALIGVAADEDMDNEPEPGAQYDQRRPDPIAPRTSQGVQLPSSPLGTLTKLVLDKGVVDEVVAYMVQMFGVDHSSKLTAPQIASVMNAIMNGTIKKKVVAPKTPGPNFGENDDAHL